MSESPDIRAVIFKYRSFTPLPFLVLMVCFARPTLSSLLLGFCLLVGGEALRFWGVSIAGSETRTTGRVGGTYLITNGPFAYVRNPLYLGNMIIYAAIGIMSLALFPWLLLVAVLWFYVQYTLIVTREEEYLASTFGAEYAAYCGAVRRFVPRITPYRSARAPEKTVSFREGLASERRTLQAVILVSVALVVLYLLRLEGS
jgi:protein-S-isoprenylcysteine O-methyltransferase Ste14